MFGQRDKKMLIFDVHDEYLNAFNEVMRNPYGLNEEEDDFNDQSHYFIFEESKNSHLISLLEEFVPKVKLINLLNSEALQDVSFSTQFSYQHTKENINYLKKVKTNPKKKDPVSIRGIPLKGRIPLNSDRKGDHQKYASDNIVRLIKSNLFEIIREHLNTSINKEKWENFEVKNDGFFKLSHKQFVKNIKKKFNENLLTRTIESIYSSNISTKYKTQNKKHNEVLIEKLKNMVGQEKICAFLQKTFQECLDYFRLSIECSEGSFDHMQTINDFFKKIIDKVKEDKKMNDELRADYICSVILIVYGYKRFFEVKDERERKGKENNESPTFLGKKRNDLNN